MSTYKPATLDSLIKYRDQLLARIDRLTREKDDINLELDATARRLEATQLAIDNETLLVKVRPFMEGESVAV